MGSCYSTQTNDSVTPSTPKVISLNGALQEFYLPVIVSQVLQLETTSCFLCNSDNLYYDEYIPVLDHGEQLYPGQIYFVLPIARLKYQLTASDMAALAVKASLALAQVGKKSRRGKKMRVSPVLDVNQGVVGDGDFDGFSKRLNYKVSTGFSRSGSVRKFHWSGSRRAKMAYRSFRVRLSTIHEESVSE
ncbi:uncharacterized protein LOC143865293 [Tasmannia lanceolata]|uniref:uncharacterized protein LOC143865293 n=1 Tax=Tasmannia lanceolata TaxID=3420 RepID=UPI00406350E0